MPVKLDELGALFETVARERGVNAELLGVIPSEAPGCYAEIIAVLPATGQRIEIGIQRDAPLADVARRIVDTLIAPSAPSRRDP